MTAPKTLAKLSIGYREYVMPIADAQTVMNILAQYPRVEDISYKLVELDPVLYPSGTVVETSPNDYDNRLRMDVFRGRVMPEFDQQFAIERLKEAAKEPF